MNYWLLVAGVFWPEYSYISKCPPNMVVKLDRKRNWLLLILSHWLPLLCHSAVQLLSSSQILDFFADRLRHFPASAHTKSGSARQGHFPARFLRLRLWLTGLFGGYELFGHFDTGSEVSSVRSVLGPKCLYTTGHFRWSVRTVRTHQTSAEASWVRTVVGRCCYRPKQNPNYDIHKIHSEALGSEMSGSPSY